MAAPFPFSVTSAEVGSYFIGQYYQILQQQPEFVHQFYSDVSTMVRVDSNRPNARETASGMLQIHTVIMSLHYTGIEIKTVHSLESWSGGVLVMVSGSVHVKDFSGSRKFTQTFFLAPQEKGYFVLNDIFHLVDDEQLLQHPVTYITPSNLDSKLNTSASIQDQVSNYILGGEIQASNFVPPTKIKENGNANNYNFTEEHLQQVPESDRIHKDNFTEQSNGPLPSKMDTVQDQLHAPIEEPVSETQKHTYASILQVAKRQPVQAVAPQSSFNKAADHSEWQHTPEPTGQLPSAPSNNVEKPGAEVEEEFSALEDELEVKSVYVRNVPTTMDPYEIEVEFTKFGTLKPDGVAIRTRKDIDVCYAFVEFEDVTSVQNAIKASTVLIGGHQLYIEGRRPNRNSFSRGRGRGRGRITYQMEGRGARFSGRAFGRSNGHDRGDREYRSRGNGFHRQGPRQERGFSSNPQGSRNGQSSE
ncbi:nuclear transport factor 2-like isoform X1 [Ipomoea triloba]|uniref:nuclear transport factor 2-like isoform X1 n=2 Tax=Ipomoea triloba TaxID=35885 RepID=UPI00125E5FCA|nr:nuclear transport factor 2-like isoform X1 [Ipomoea triloba]